MAVDVLYEGVVLARGAEVRQTAAGLYIALDAPMPVGTTLALDEKGRAHRVKVARVHEGIGPGVVVVGESLPAPDVVVAPANVPPPSADALRARGEGGNGVHAKAVAAPAPAPPVEKAPEPAPAPAPPVEKAPEPAPLHVEEAAPHEVVDD